MRSRQKWSQRRCPMTVYRNSDPHALYKLERNALIKFAERHADGLFGATSTAPALSWERKGWVIGWNRAFLGEMDRLARENGLIK